MSMRKYCWKLFILPFLAAPLAAWAEPLYGLTFLPEGFYPAGINGSGQVVGTYDGGAAVWSASGAVTSLGALLPGSEGLGINNRGDIVGRHGDAAFLYANGALVDLPVPGSRSWATGINDAGQVAGSQAGYSRIDSQQGFVYSDGAVTVIETGLNHENQAYAYAINGAGVVAGTAITSAGDAWADPPRQAFTYADGALRIYGTLGGSISEAEDINDAGMLAGWSSDAQETGNLAFLYNAQDGMVDLGSLGGTLSRAHGLNNLGWVVGQSDVGGASGFDFHAFLYHGGGMADLNALLELPAGWQQDGWQLVSARDVNDAGQILAEACQATSGDCRAVLLDLLSPIPEPSSWAMLLAGLGLLLAAGRRRLGPRLAVLLGLPLSTAAFAAAAGTPPAFTMTAAPSGFTANALNNAGQVAGTWMEGTDQQAAALWQGGTVTTIAGLAPGSIGLGLNDRGHIVGIWNSEAFLYTPGVVRDLGRISFWGLSRAVAVNDGGDVAGTGYQNWDEEWRGWVYSRNICSATATLGGDWTEMRAINKAGDAVGVSAQAFGRSPFGDPRAFLFSKRVLHDLGALGNGRASVASDINDSGQVVGAAEYAFSEFGPILMHPFLYQDGRMRDLGTLGGATGAANGISNAGAIVGEALLADGVTRHAFLLEHGVLRDLHALTAMPPGWVLVSARDINDRRQVLAQACLNEDCIMVRLDPAADGAGGKR